jgi:histidine kinase
MLHFPMAQSFMALPTSTNKEYVHEAAQHANSAKLLYESAYGRVALVKVNLEAAKYYMRRNVFFAAAEHLREAATMWRKDGTEWTQDYELSLELNERLTAVQMVLGDFESCADLVNDLLLHGTSEETQTTARWSQILVKLGEFDNVGAIEAGRVALRDLGVNFPTKVNMLHVVRKLMRVRRLLSGKNEDDILGLPMIDDPRKIAVQRILLHMGTLLMQDDKGKDGLYATLSVLEHTMVEGLSEYSATGLANYAVAEIALGNKERGYHYGQLALVLSRTPAPSQMEIATVSLLCVAVIHWKEPINSLVGPLFRVFGEHFPGQNLWYGALAAANGLGCALHSGTHLKVVKATGQSILSKFKEYKQDQLAEAILPTYQLALNLAGAFDNWIDAVALTGEAMDEKEYMRTCDPQLQDNVTMNNLILAYQFGYYDVAERALKTLGTANQLFRVHIHFPIHQFYAGMTYIALYRQNRKRRYLWRARSHKRQLLKLRAVACPNSEPLLQILLAEEASLKSADLPKYQLSMKEAAETCRKAGLVQYEGLLYERAGFIFAGYADFVKAEDYFVAAMELYQDAWGSCAKYDWLHEKSQQALKQPRTSKRMWGREIEIPSVKSHSGDIVMDADELAGVR